MDQLEAHRRAQDQFAAVLANVSDDQLGLPTPCTEWTVQDLLDHVNGANCWVVQLTGAEVPELPDDRLEAHATSAAAAQAVFAAPDGLTRTYALPFAELPGFGFIGMRIGDTMTHAWDLAVATGQSTDLDTEVAAAALAASQARISPAFRGPGRPFGEEQPCPEGATTADQLAAFLGRPVG